MKDDNEIEMVWVEFVGGPLDGQCRRLPRAQTHLNAVAKLPKYWEEIRPDMTVIYVTYRIERRWKNEPKQLGFHEWFLGVLA